MRGGIARGTGALSYKKQKNGVGVIFYSRSTNRHLFLLRASKSPGEWGLPGGKTERGETLKDALRRECLEEINFWPEDIKLFPIEQFTSSDGNFVYHTFYSMIESEFIPRLNHEHTGYAWVDRQTYPKPLHRGLFNTLNYKIIQEKINLIHESAK